MPQNRNMTCGNGVRSYWSGCRCDECRAAATQYARDRAERFGPQKRKRKTNPSKPHRSNAEILARNENGGKQCNTCWEWLPDTEFYGLKTALDGLTPRCKTCERLSKKGIARQRVIELLADQGSGCGICHGIFYSFSEFHIDHDHSCCSGVRSCGECVRGLLCANCNFRVMSIIDDAEKLRAGFAYAGVI